jgi:hypothetical protein
MDVEMITREQKRDALNLVRMDGWSDPWGTANAHMFGACTALYVNRLPIPDGWRFDPGPRPGPKYTPERYAADMADSWPDSEYLTGYSEGWYTPEQLRYIGAAMLRMIHRIQRAGLGTVAS